MGRPKGKPLWTSAMRSLHGWTLTKPLKRMNTKTNKKRLKAFATQSLPSFTRQQEVPQVVCPEVCPQVLEVCQVQVHPQVQDPDPLSKRSTNICSLLDNEPHQQPEVSRFFSSNRKCWLIYSLFDHQYLLVVNKLLCQKLLLKTKSFCNFLFLSDLNKTFKYNSILF